MHHAICAIVRNGERVAGATKGANTELRAVRLELTNPRARLSLTESRGKPFSCLGELCWYLAGTNDVEFIKYYLARYEKADEEGVVFGGYGPRLVSCEAGNQIVNVTRLLQERPDTRRAVIQLFDAADLLGNHKDVPCTCTLQLLLRSDALHMIVHMRSNDVIWGLPHDVFCFTMLQEMIASTLHVKLGTYTHFAGSLHMYDDTRADADSFIQEGWQSTKLPMPPMPVGDPWPAVEKLLKYEEALRVNGQASFDDIEQLDVYWADIARLLEIFRCIKDKNRDKLLEVGRAVSSDAYRQYIDVKVRELSVGRNA